MVEAEAGTEWHSASRIDVGTNEGRIGSSHETPECCTQ